jgi:molybdenum cofactor cytidylyltransferase
MSSLAVAVLAAGSSSRFGAEDKLAAPFRGKSLGLRATDALAGQDFSHRWVIVRTLDHPCIAGWMSEGFEPVLNTHAATGMGSSLRRAVELADVTRAEGLMVCLADMPLVEAAHVTALAQLWREQGGIVASRDGDLVSPPAIFARAFFGMLADLDGDRGGRALLEGAACITAPQGSLVDIDDPKALHREEGRF